MAEQAKCQHLVTIEAAYFEQMKFLGVPGNIARLSLLAVWPNLHPTPSTTSSLQFIEVIW
jgi:hypothetical protein